MRATFSIVIPAYNEEKYLPKCLAAIDAARARLGEPVQVIVADNVSRDRTPEIAREFGAEIVSVEEKCLSVIRNRGAAAATGVYLVFIDADSVMSENMLVAIKEVMESGRSIGGGVANCWLDRMSLGIFLTFVAIIPLWIRDRAAMVLFYTTPEAFRAISGFNEALYALEDLDFARRLKRLAKERGLKYTNLFRARVITSARKFDQFGDWYVLRHPSKILQATRNDRETANEFWYNPKR